MRRATLFLLLYMGLPLECSAQLNPAREFGKIEGKKLDEISGCAISKLNPGILWVHNDGGTNSVYAIRVNGKVVARVDLPFDMIDLEDIAIGPHPHAKSDFLYLGDIGDNDQDRDSIRVIAFPEPLLNVHVAEIRIPYLELYSLTYPDAAHDAETLLFDPIEGALLIVTKSDSGARLYGFDLAPLGHSGRNHLNAMGDLSVSKVSGGDISRDGRHLILRRNDRGWLWTRRRGRSLGETFSENPNEVTVRGSSQGPNGESIGFVPDRGGYFTISEGKNETIWLFTHQ